MSAPTADVALSVLDLVPIVEGSDARAALHNTLDLARRTERLGYRRYWIAEHHLNPGVAGSSPAIVLTMVAGVTQHIRVGSGAVQLSHQRPLAVVEQFGLIDALHPGRVDLGLGRSFLRRPRSTSPAPPRDAFDTPAGLHVPAPVSLAHLATAPRVTAQRTLLDWPGAPLRHYADEVDEVLALLRGTARADGVDVVATPGSWSGVEVWIVGSSAGESADVAGGHGLPFAANYHVSPATVLDAVRAYRRAFRPSTGLAQPRVIVSADVVVGRDDAEARRLASGYAPWVRSIRSGEGAIPYPSPETAAEASWTPRDRALVEDRVATQFVGDPDRVVAGLAVLAAETDAEEILVTTITHEHAARVRSYELLAHAWARHQQLNSRPTRAVTSGVQ